MTDKSDKPVIEVFHTGEDWHPYPWRFRIIFRDVTYSYCGIPNKCATKREAAARAGWRAKWLREGTYDGRYTPEDTTGGNNVRPTAPARLVP